MKTAVQLVSLMLSGIIVAATATAQEPGAQSTDPAAASSPHQREATEQPATESQVTPTSDPGAAASPHQQEVTGVTADPATFVKMAAQGGLTEVALGKIAMTKGHDPSVRAFGERMVKDHGKANAELSGIAKKKGIEAPSALDSQHQTIVDKLNGKGADFDAAYSTQMMADHDKTVALFDAATKSSDAELAAFAKKTLPTLQEHKRLAQALPRS